MSRSLRWSAPLEPAPKRSVPSSQAALDRLKTGDAAGAEAAARAVLAANPNDVVAHQVLGVLAYQVQDFETGLERFRRVVELAPTSVDGLYNLAEALKKLRRYAEAAPIYRKSANVNPGNIDTWINFSFTLIELGQYGEAIAAAEAALALDPNSAPAIQNLSIAQWALGYVSEGVDTIRRALALEPDRVSAWSNLLMYLQYSAAHSEDELVAAARAFGRTMERPRVGPEASSMPEPSRLRVGYVSGDFYDHPVGRQIEKVLEGHDRDRIEVFLYATARIQDALTEELRGHADAWRDLTDDDDETAARRIAADGVHVLVDLSGHTALNRLGIFAHRPAPVQTSWLGYFATTGLSQIDFVMRDPDQIPAEEAGFYSERFWVLEDAAFGYRPHDACPELTPPPARRNGYVTFGCFANLAKVSAEAIQAWAGVLNRVPGSRMILDRKGMDDPLGQARILREFARQGIGPERLEFAASRGHLAYLARYAEIDVVLDSFPCNGATTTYEALWMGVPVVSHRWSRMVGHFAESILGPCGHRGWVARDEAGYVETAVALASDLDGLERLRGTLRSELAASPLCQAGDCARSLERAYAGMWREIRGEVPDADTIALLQRDLMRRPDDAHLWFETILPLARLGFVAEAFASFERGAALDPSIVQRRGGALFARLGDALAAQGRFEEAIVCFAESVKLSEGGVEPETVRAKAVRMLERAAA